MSDSEEYEESYDESEESVPSEAELGIKIISGPELKQSKESALRVQAIKSLVGSGGMETIVSAHQLRSGNVMVVSHSTNSTGTLDGSPTYRQHSVILHRRTVQGEMDRIRQHSKESERII